MHAALTLVCWKEAAGLLPCLNSKESLPPLLGLAAKGRRLHCSLLQMDAMLREEKFTVYLIGLRNAPLGQQMDVLEITALRGGSTWVQARSQAQLGTAAHALTRGTAVERASPQGPCQGWCCTSLEQYLCVCDQSPMVFGPEWEVKLQEKCWLLFLQRSSGSTGSGSTCWHVAFWAAVLFILESREVSPWKQQCCSTHRVIPEIYSSEKTIIEVWWEAWWPQPLQGRKGWQWRGHAGVLFGPLGPKLCWVQSKLWEIGCLDLFPHQNLLRGVAAFTKLRTFCSPGSLWTCWPNVGVEVGSGCSGGCFLSFFCDNLYIPSCVGGWWDTGRGGWCDSHITHLPV